MKSSTRFVRLLAAVLVLAAAVSAPAAEPNPKSAEALNAQLTRIFSKKEFDAKKFGPYAWTEGGKAYTTLEASSGQLEGKDLVRYDTATGARRVLVKASTLTAPGGKPLDVESYTWSTDGKK